MEHIFICVALILGYTFLCVLYAVIGLCNKNSYLRYSLFGLIVVHGFLQGVLLFHKIRLALLVTDSLTYFQVVLFLVGIVCLIISACVDRYIMKQEKRDKKIYNHTYFDELRLLAREKGASEEIQELLKYMTPKKCQNQDEKIEMILNDLSERNMEEGYLRLKNIVHLREETLKCR